MTPAQQKRALIVAAAASFITAVQFFLIGVWLNVLLDGLDSITCVAVGLTTALFAVLSALAVTAAVHVEDGEP